MGRQELHELGVTEGVPLAVEDGGHLVGDVQDFPGDQGHGRGKHVLEGSAGCGESGRGPTGGALTLGGWQAGGSSVEGQAGPGSLPEP